MKCSVPCVCGCALARYGCPDERPARLLLPSFEYANIIVMSSLCAVFFLGGWLLPVNITFFLITR